MNLGRLLFPALRWRPATGFAHEDGAIDLALELGAGGFIVFGVPGARADEIGRLTEELRYRAGRPLLIGADLERGAGQQARRLTECPPPGALASLQDDEVIRWAAATTARDALRVGINWVFAPVADLDLEPDNPIVQTRSFGADPEPVARAVALWISTCQVEGALACAKHYPGHGRTVGDSHDLLPAVDLPLERLSTTDLVPFQAAVRARVGSVMTGHVAFPRWDPSGLPATRSPVILEYLRTPLGFEGLLVTDAFIMAGARGGASEAEAAVAALAAGCDILLYPGDPGGTLAALRRAAETGTLPAARIDASLERYAAALGWAGDRTGAPPAETLYAEQVAARLLAAGLRRGDPGPLGSDIELAVVDDDLGGWYPPGPNDLVRRALAARGIVETHGGSRVVLAFAEARAAKGRASFGPASLERLAALVPGAALVVLFGHPRLVGQIPGAVPVLLAWHRQRLMQEAVAVWLQDRLAAP